MFVLLTVLYITSQVSRRGVECHQKSVRCLVVTTSGNHLVTGSDDGEVRVWQITNMVEGGHMGTKVHSAHLALKRIVHMGRGPITNLAVLYTDREVGYV